MIKKIILFYSVHMTNGTLRCAFVPVLCLLVQGGGFVFISTEVLVMSN